MHLNFTFHVSEIQENACVGRQWKSFFLWMELSRESDVRVLRAILQVRRQYRRDGEIAKALHSTVFKVYMPLPPSMLQFYAESNALPHPISQWICGVDNAAYDHEPFRTSRLVRSLHVYRRWLQLGFAVLPVHGWMHLGLEVRLRQSRPSAGSSWASMSMLRRMRHLGYLRTWP